jgi:predicted nicotinamide N-methyase
LKKVLSITRNSPIQVVELGAGCGIVGIGLVQMLANCSVLLTDLAEVEDIITRNINASHPATMSSVKYRNLDWGNPPDDLCSCPIELILVSDCTYNEDSLPVLVSALDRLVRTSPDAVILVALKRRHDSETKFFDLMASAGFMSEMESMELPSQHGEVDKIEFHCYSRQL